MKVLIAGSTDDVEDIMSSILLEEGYDCVFVKDSKEVIDNIYVEQPDVIILDILLSNPSSLEILSQLKSAPSTRGIPVILIASKRSRLKLVKGYELGAYDYISRPFFKQEILSRIKNITFACDRIKELEKLLDRDYLTGLYNRRFFMERFLEEIAWSVRYKEPLSLMMLDIDFFKRINDTYGHGCGDEILKQISSALLSVLRAEDIVARYGGEEFIILLPNTSAEGAITAAEKLRATVQNRTFVCKDSNNGDMRLSVTISIGVTIYNGETELSPDRLIGQADGALYSAKESGRNRVVVYKGT
ncbi:diguanylate cyclase response regulator [Dissulfurispira thermophila]|uniref:diguanylate cyclase n=2 Tax=root TaxID=1 RepID=A0A7G1H3H5_9BACT|nr:diguanylate cyclase [Dissulfurispira thermophila]BCB96673.1 diguanylate cyclase response regulator [Dissulfurispira thermophila]